MQKQKEWEEITQGAPVGTVDFIKKIGGKVTNFFVENRKMYASVGVLIAMMMLIMASFTSCSVMFLNKRGRLFRLQLYVYRPGNP